MLALRPVYLRLARLVLNLRKSAIRGRGDPSTAMNTIAPYKIRQMTLDATRWQVRLRSLLQSKPLQAANKNDLPGYLVTSTAPYNTDDIAEAERLDEASQAQATAGILAIAQNLREIETNPNITAPPELLIAVHGYNTEENGIRAWYSDIYRHIAQDDAQIREQQNLVFVGYRWSSERLSMRIGNLWANTRALPDVLQGALAMGGIIFLSYWLWTLLWHSSGNMNRVLIWGLQALFGGAIASIMVILTLLLLRITGYFRDVYRAINFGVPDLTELIRQIDQAVIELRAQDLRQQYSDVSEAMRQAKEQGDRYQKIQLNFLGHSMGALVITNVVRILSDVFDTRSISRDPGSEIGNTLSLGRLILASPDIPVLAIVSSRANGLMSSLRRFREAYLFSNEGDLALRVASTAANYISFPSRGQSHGHRLGSIALTNDVYSKGIINLSLLRQHYPIEENLCDALAKDPLDILNCLFITHSSGKGKGYVSLGDLFRDENCKDTHATLADLFTFFDCTDYKDFRLTLGQNGWRESSKTTTGLLTRAKQKRNLNLWDYVELVYDSLLGRRDVHGGYFNGEYSRQLIYRIGFLGFEGALNAISQESVAAEADDRLTALDVFDRCCADKGIQVYLSPLRYRVDVQGADLRQAKKEMLQTVNLAKKTDSQDKSWQALASSTPRPAPKSSIPLTS